LWVSILSSIIICIFIGIATEKFLFRVLRRSGKNSFVLLIVSLGLYIIFQNLISLIWGDNIKSIRTGEVKVGNSILGVIITDIQLAIVFICILLFSSLFIIYHKTKIGRTIKAVSENAFLSNVFGIDPERVVVFSYIIGSAIAAIAGILVAFDTDMTPTMGFRLLLYGVVAMIIGGVGSTWGLIGGSLLLATAQHLGAYYIDSKWMDAIAYTILILFLIWKPLGFSGRRLKKTEV
jgi:branched-subunit amino acid ABC-type transport system permease component